jgi:sigma factor-binding protein Crl
VSSGAGGWKWKHRKTFYLQLQFGLFNKDGTGRCGNQRSGSDRSPGIHLKEFNKARTALATLDLKLEPADDFSSEAVKLTA